MSHERLSPYVGEELAQKAMEAVSRFHATGDITGQDMDTCLAFSGISRRELARRCKAADHRPAIRWSKLGPPPPVARYVVELVEHTLTQPIPPKPEDWWSENMVQRDARLGLAAAE